MVNVVGRVEYRRESGEDLFGLGAEAVRLLAEDLRKIMLRAPGLVHGGADELFGRVGDLALDEQRRLPISAASAVIFASFFCASVSV